MTSSDSGGDNDEEGAGDRVFRGFLAALCLFAWVALCYFASHLSESPAVLGRWSAGYFMLLCALAGFAGLATLLHLGPLYRRVARFRGAVLGLALGAGAALILAEVGVRVLDPLGISYYQSAKEYHEDKLPDDELIFRHRPNYRATYGGIDYSFNDLGLRDRAVGVRRPGELRVLFLGDSITLGAGVSIEDAFPLGVERRLAQRLRRPVRTINSGVGGYNTTQEWAFLKRHGDALLPDAIFLLYVYNDVEINMPFDPRRFGLRGKSPPEVVKALLGRSWAYRLVSHILRHSGDRPRTIGTAAGREASEAAIREIAAWAKERGIAFAVGYWRAPGMAEFNGLTWRWLTKFGEQQGFAVVDVADWLGDSGPEAYRLSVVDSHPTPEGHSHIAEGIADLLESQLQPRQDRKLCPPSRRRDRPAEEFLR